jgi:peptidoglycan/xylan/chitin deacetylase (PgdA/CDA1 family)
MEEMRLPILMYHQVTPAPHPRYPRYTLTPKQFGRHMRWLASRGYTPLSLDDYLECRAGRRRWPPRPVIITFDDGYAEGMRYAADIMSSFGFPGTVFLVASSIGGTSTWDEGVSMPVIDWRTLRELMQQGFSCGSHSLTHPRLADLTRDACMRELRDSRRQLEDGLGTQIRHLSYPYGSVNATVRQAAVEAGYATGCSARFELSSTDDDVMLLPRVLMVSSDSMADFVCRLRTARTLGVMVRARVERVLGLGRRG